MKYYKHFITKRPFLNNIQLIFYRNVSLIVINMHSKLHLSMWKIEIICNSVLINGIIRTIQLL